MNLYLSTYQQFGGAIVAPPTIISQPVNCLLGYNTASLLFDTATNLPLVGSINATTIVCTEITDNCTGLKSIVVGDSDNVQALLDNSCCVQWLNSCKFVNLLDDTSFPAVIGTNVNFPKVALIDLSAYGGSVNALVNNDQDIIDAFAVLPTPIIVQVNNGELFFPTNYFGAITDIEVKESLLKATIVVDNAPSGFIVNTTNIKKDGSDPTSTDKVRIVATMNGVTLDSGLITWGDTAAMSALDWASVGITREDDTILNLGNFTWVGNTFNIIDAYKNVSNIYYHPNFPGNPALYKGIPDINKAFPITLDYTLYEDGVDASATVTDTVVTQKYLEYLTSFMSKQSAGSVNPYLKGSTIVVLSNVAMVGTNYIPLNATVDGVANQTLYNRQISNQTNDKLEFSKIKDNITSVTTSFTADYIFPYSNVNAHVEANNFSGTVATGGGTNAEQYNYAFLNNNTANQALYNYFCFADDTGSMNGTSSLNQTITLNGGAIPPSVGTILPTNPFTHNANSAAISVTNQLNLLSLPVGVMHELRMDVSLQGPRITNNGLASFAKFATTQFIISNR